jgi:hypothetical protein
MGEAIISRRGGGADARQGDNVALASSISGTTLKLRAPAGEYDGVDDNVTITNANFITGNIRNDKNLFGIIGTLREKIDITDYGLHIPSGYQAVAYIEETDEFWVKSTTGNNSAYKIDKSGNIIQTVTFTLSTFFRLCDVTPNYMLWNNGTSDNGINRYVTDRNLNILASENSYSLVEGAINEEAQRIFAGRSTSAYPMYVYDLNLTMIGGWNTSATSYPEVRYITSRGCFFTKNTASDSIAFMSNEGVVTDPLTLEARWSAIIRKALK